MTGTDPALETFERFLTDWHEGRPGVSIDALCDAHPAEADRFRRWWQQLVRTGEVSEPPPSSSTGTGSATVLVEGATFGPYRLQRELGRGAQGMVFLAEDTRLRRAVALKVLPAHRARGRDFARRFAREAELASRLDDPGIVTIFERGEIDGSVFLAMRCIDGETLAGCIARAERQHDSGDPRLCVRLPGPDDDGSALDEAQAIARVLAVFERIALALHTAHERNLIHRDVKPGNVLVDQRGHPVLVDFGLARDVDEPAVTLTGDLVGTPAYLSPEQLAALRIELDRRTDIWSLAVTLYECLTLRRPFDGATRDQLYQQILTAEPAPVRTRNPAVPRDLAVVLTTALQKDRNRRYQTARDLAEDLRRLRAHEPILARPPGPLRRLAQWSRRSPALAATTVLAFAALLLGLGLSLAYALEARRARTTFARLADRTLLDQAIAAAPALYPAHPGRVEGFRNWLQRYAEPLARRLPEHAAALAELWAQADAHELPRDRNDERAELQATIDVCRHGLEGDQQVRIPLLRPVLEQRRARAEARLRELTDAAPLATVARFRDDDAQVAYDQLAALVQALRGFVAPDGLAARIRRDAALAADVHAQTVVAQQDAWREAAARVAQDPRHASRVLQPQVGLIPLGPDRTTGLEEFALYGSGAIPQRDAGSGTLALDGASALVLVLIPGGPFEFAVDEGGLDRAAEQPPIQLDWYLLGKTELSQGQWRRLAAEPGPVTELLEANGCGTDAHPADGVSWPRARELLQRFGLDLPTEAQWEHAARGGRASRHWWGDGIPTRASAPIGNLRDASLLAAMVPQRVPTMQYDDGVALTAPVGSFRGEHPFGLCDVYGNVAEWCLESFAPATPAWFPARAGDGLHRMLETEQHTVRGGWCYTRPNALVEGPVRDGVLTDVTQTGVGVRAARRVE